VQTRTCDAGRRGASLSGLSKAEHVAYRGTPEAVTDAMTGRVLYAFAPGPNAVPLAKSGKLQILATTSPAGARFFPGVPRSARPRAGLRGRRLVRRVRPAGTRLRSAAAWRTKWRVSSRLPRCAKRLAALGAEPAFLGPAEFEAMVRDYLARTRKLGDEIGIKAQ